MMKIYKKIIMKNKIKINKMKKQNNLKKNLKYKI